MDFPQFLKNKKFVLLSVGISLVDLLFLVSVFFYYHEGIKNVVAKQAFERASYYFNGGAYDLDKAEHWYKIALAIQPKLINTHYQLARVYFVKGDFDKALAEINTEIKSNPQNVRSYYIKGLIDGYRIDYQAAIADFEKFVEWSPQDWAGYNDLAWAQYKAKDFKAAEKTISSALKNVSPNAFLLNGLGVAKLGQKQFDEAKKVFASALQASQDLTVKDWQRAYPGNNPAEAEKKLEEFKDDLTANAGLADKKLSLGGIFAAACSASSYNSCSGTTCISVPCEIEHNCLPSSCSNDCDCGGTPPPPASVSHTCTPNGPSCGGPAGSYCCTVSWSPAPGATFYALRVDDAQTPGTDIVIGLSGTSYSFWAYAGHSFNWWVHSNCFDGSPNSVQVNGESFFLPLYCSAGCGAWGACSVSCGGGTQTRTCTRADCSTYTETQACNTQACVYAPTLSFSANPTSITQGNSSRLTWTTSNADSCWAWGGGIDGWKTSTGGYQDVWPSSNTTYYMECWNSAGTSSGQKSATVNVSAPPPGNFSLSLGGSVACNSVPLSWTAASDAQAYRILRGNPRVDISPYQPYTAQNFIDTTVSQNTTYQYQIEAYNSGGTNRSNTINVDTPYCPPTLIFSAAPTSIYQGQSVTLSWNTSYTTSCTASSNPNQSAWSGSKALSGSQVVVPLPPPRVTYNLQCSGPGGSASDSATINILPLLLPDWIEIIPR